MKDFSPPPPPHLLFIAGIQKWGPHILQKMEFAKKHNPSIQNWLILRQTASRRAESKDVERHSIFPNLASSWVFVLDWSLRTSSFSSTSSPVLINQSVSQSINQSVNRSIDQSINQSINQSIDQSINQSIDRSIDHSMNQSNQINQ